MGGVIDDVAGLFGEGRGRAAIDAQNNAIAQQIALWERQFGGASDAMNRELTKVLEPDWKDQYLQKIKQGIDEGVRPSEEAAREALRTKVRSAPRSISSQGYAKGLKDIVKEGANARGSAYRQGISSAELTPFNLGLAFLNRTPFTPSTPGYPPDYKLDVEGAKLVGSGLRELVSQGSNAYQNWFGPREDFSSGFESYYTDEGGNMGMGPAPSEGEVW